MAACIRVEPGYNEQYDSKLVHSAIVPYNIATILSIITYGYPKGELDKDVYNLKRAMITLFLEISAKQEFAFPLFEDIKMRLNDETLLKEYYDSQNPPRLSFDGTTALLFSLGYLGKKP